MEKLKKDLPKIGCRPSRKTGKMFKKKCFRMGIEDDYTTQDRVLCEMMDMFNSGKIKMPWEGK